MSVSNAKIRYFCLAGQYYPIQGEYVGLVESYEKNCQESGIWGRGGTVCCSSGVSAMVCHMPLVGTLLCAVGAHACFQTFASESASDLLHDQIYVKVLSDKIIATPDDQLTFLQIATAIKVKRTIQARQE